MECAVELTAQDSCGCGQTLEYLSWVLITVRDCLDSVEIVLEVNASSVACTIVQATEEALTSNTISTSRSYITVIESPVQ
jgi:hypothetical protein